MNLCYQKDRQLSSYLLTYGRPARSQTGKVQSIERYNPAREKWYRSISQPVKDSSGNVVSVLEGVTDITEPKEAEQAILREPNFLRQVMETSPAGITVVDREGHVSLANFRAEEILGLKRSDMYNRRYNDPAWRITDFEGNQYPEDRLPFQLVKRKKAPVFGVEHAIVWPDGKRALLSISGAPLFDSNGNFDGMVASIEDVTEQKRKEVELHNRNQFIQAILDNLPIGLAVNYFDEGTATYMNQRFQEIYGWPEEELKNIPEFFEKVYPDAEYRNEIQGRILADIESGDPKRMQWNHVEATGKDGTKRIVSAKNIPILEQNFMISTVQDVTEQERTRKALEESHAKYRQLVENSPAGIYEFDYTSGKIVNVNDALCEYMGYTRDEILSMSPLDLLTGDSKAVALDRMQRVMAGETPPETTEYKIRCKDGSEIWSQGHIRYFYEGETLTRAIAVMHDVTGQKQAEAALKESEERFRTLVEQSPFGISLINKDGRYQYLNPKFKEMFGYELEDIPTGKKWFQKVYPQEEYRQEVISTWKEDQKNIGIGEARPRTYSVICTDGEKKVTHFRPVTMKNGDQLVFHEDVTEAEILEEQLRQAEKLEAIATLTGGIAHDYNNLLSIIVGNLGMAQQDAEPGSHQAEFLNEAEKAARKVGDLTHELMALSRGGGPIKELGSIKESLRESANVIPAESGITVNVSMQEDVWPVPHDSRKMAAVFRKVVQNALEAMPDGGSLTLNAQNLRVEDGDSVPGLSVTPGDYVRISIQDNGIGISEDNLDKIFDPYFSTKAMGTQKGMGLGLATAHAIVKKHGGDITVQSKHDVGTTVNIYLPAMPSPQARQAGLPAQPEEGEGKDGRPVSTETQSTVADQQAPMRRILLMDDEEMMRNLAPQMLNRLGYEVETVKGGFEAIEAYQKRIDAAEPFDAVILDLTIKGGMGGERAVQELLKIDPQVKAIVASGYFNDPVMKDFQDYGFKAAMPKPFVMKDLKEVIENALSAED